MADSALTALQILYESIVPLSQKSNVFMLFTSLVDVLIVHAPYVGNLA